MITGGVGHQSDGNRLIIRSKAATTTFEKMVSMVVGSKVHTEYIIIDPHTQECMFSYTAYQGGRVEMYLTPNSVLMDKSFVNTAINLQNNEVEKLRVFLMSMVDVVPYNWTDSRLLLPILQRNGALDMLIDDVDSSIPAKIKKVYCSQIGVLAMRECLDPDGPNSEMLKRLRALNSRLVSPQKLHDIVCEFGHDVDGDALLELASNAGKNTSII